jgi:benzoyl-CoA reductase/2-hydroxyglutaryl-CoA dehydratase subunit BcrC/BadD/HgdB
VCSSPWIPAEWLAAHGLTPRGIWSQRPLPGAVLSEGTCGFAQTVRNVARAKSGPLVIFTTACDQMRRAADETTFPHRSTFLFNLPSTWQSSIARQLYRDELVRLGRFLVELGGKAPTPGALESKMREYDAARQRLRRSMSTGSARDNARAVASLFDGAVPGSDNHREVAAAHPQSGSARESGIPLALLGGPLQPHQWNIFESVEAAGGRITLNAAEPGERSLFPPLPDFKDEPLTTLADYYFDNIADVYQRPNTKLYDWLSAAFAKRPARGLVLLVHIGCDLWRAEAASLREAFGMPVLVLDAHGAASSELRDANRLAAFVESLE